MLIWGRRVNNQQNFHSNQKLGKPAHSWLICKPLRLALIFQRIFPIFQGVGACSEWLWLTWIVLNFGFQLWDLTEISDCQGTPDRTPPSCLCKPCCKHSFSGVNKLHPIPLHTNQCPCAAGDLIPNTNTNYLRIKLDYRFSFLNDN